MSLGDKKCEFFDRFWHPEPIEKAYKDAGFVDFEWIKYSPIPGSKVETDPFYDDWLKGKASALICFRA